MSKMAKAIFKEEIIWRGEKYLIRVFDRIDYSKLNNIAQVYGFIFNKKGEMLIVKCGPKKAWCLPGGTPEKEDKRWKETLIREVEEEADVEIDNIIPAGYITPTPKGE